MCRQKINFWKPPEGIGKELGLEVHLINGDNKKTDETIGKDLGIESIFAEVVPRKCILGEAGRA